MEFDEVIFDKVSNPLYEVTSNKDNIFQDNFPMLYICQRVCDFSQ